MEANRRDEPVVFVEGIDKVIRLDLEKHKELLTRRKLDKLSWQSGVSHHVKMKRHYKTLIGGGKFNDEALKKSIGQINLNITHLQQKVKLSDDAIEHETLIVDTLTDQLKTYEDCKRAFTDRCGKQADPSHQSNN